jgi:hypothetical protein|nr:MAG TPA: major capsid protein [Caudoviricetes sp.]
MSYIAAPQKDFGIFSKEEYKQKMRVYNAQTLFVNPGYEQVITTTTQILPGVVDPQYYELNGQLLSDFVPIEVGVGAYSIELFQYAAAYVGTDFKSCIVAPTTGNINQDGNMDIELSGFKIPNNYYRQKYSLSREGLEIASRQAVTFSLYEEKEKARKKNWDLGLQEATFLGLDDGRSFGLLNQPEAVVNTSLITKPLSEMTDEEFSTFISTITGFYFNASNGTRMFNRMLIPQSDYFALTKPYGQFGLSRLSVLENAFQGRVSADFKIVYTMYNETAGTNGGKRYAFYNYDPDSIEMYIPMPYTPYPLFPTGALDTISDAMGQFTTPYNKRKNLLQYFDIVSAS